MLYEVITLTDLGPQVGVGHPIAHLPPAVLLVQLEALVRVLDGGISYNFV